MSRIATSVAVLLFATGAIAQEDTPGVETSPVSQHAWSLVSGKTLGEGHQFVQVEVGYPAIQAEYLVGKSDTFDLGARFGFFYGTEGLGIDPGFRAQAALRWQIANSTPYKMTLEFDPGIYTAFGYIGATQFGLALTGRYTVAFPITKELTLHAGADLPFLLNFVNGVGASIPVLVGGGAEYYINDNLSLTLRLRFGPSFNAGVYNFSFFGFGNTVTLGFDTSIGVAFRI